MRGGLKNRELQKRNKKEEVWLLSSLLSDFRCTLLLLASETDSHVRACVKRTQIHKSVGSETKRETYFSVQNGGKWSKGEREAEAEGRL